MNQAPFCPASVNVILLPNGETRISSANPWFRLLSTFADLYLSDQIDADTLTNEASRWSQAILDHGDTAAQQLLGRIFLPFDEPKCLCDPYAGPCQHPSLTDVERKARFIEVVLGLVVAA